MPATPSSVRDDVLELLERNAPQHNIDIVDVEVVGSSKNPTVRVRIDHTAESQGAITLDEVSEQTGWISDLIDEADPIAGAFTLEVSSPGLARPLRKAGDYKRFAGQTIRLSTNATEGRRKFTGVLLGIEDGIVSVRCDGEDVRIPLETIRTCKIKPSFD